VGTGKKIHYKRESIICGSIITGIFYTLYHRKIQGAEKKSIISGNPLYPGPLYVGSTVLHLGFQTMEKKSRANGLSRRWDVAQIKYVAQIGCRANEISRNWDVAQMQCSAIEMSCDWDVAKLKCRADGISRQKKKNVAQMKWTPFYNKILEKYLSEWRNCIS